MEQADPRLNLPSASGLERISLCRGSRRMEATAPPDKRSKDSAFGDKSHAIIAGYFRELDPTEPWPAFKAEEQFGEDYENAEVAQRFIESAQSVYNEWVKIVDEIPGITQTVKVCVEERIVWMGKGFKPVTTGQPDVVFIIGRCALILDLKSLFGHHTTSASNMQLRTYAVLVAQKHDVEEITVAIIQPRVRRVPSLCCYGTQDLVIAREQIHELLSESEAPDAPLVAGVKQCAFCRAKSCCPAAAEFASLTPVAPERELARGEAKKIVATLSLEQRIAIWEKKGTVDKIMEAIMESIKETPADQLAAVGLAVETKLGNRKIVGEAGDVFDRVKDVVTPEAFRAICEVGISKLQETFRAAAALPVKDAKIALEERLGDLIGRQEDKKSLVRLQKKS